MFRKRLAVCILATLAVPGMTTWARVAHAQDVIDLDEEPSAKKGGKKNGNGGAKPSGKKGVDIDLDEGGSSASQAPVTAGQMTEAAAAAKQLFEDDAHGELHLSIVALGVVLAEERQRRAREARDAGAAGGAQQEVLHVDGHGLIHARRG